MVNYIVYIEGEPVNNNGDLRNGFEKLFSQKFSGKMPKIVMGEGIHKTIEKFKSHGKNSKKKNYFKLLLIDSDCPNKIKKEIIKREKLKSDTDRIFFMVQEMEAWFISQAANVLDKHYGVKISSKVPKKKASEFENPDEKIGQWLKPSGRVYSKIKDGSQMLPLLNLSQLEKEFDDVEKLVAQLNKS